MNPETFKPHPLLEVNKDQIHAVRAAINLHDPKRINQDIDLVLDWYQKENHLPRIDLDRNFVERVYVSRKGSVEQTKRKIDMMFSLKNCLSYMISPRDPLGPEIKMFFETVAQVPIPKLAPDNTRLYCLVIKNPDVDKYSAVTNGLVMNMYSEYLLHHDYAAGYRYVFDYHQFSFAHSMKLTPTFFNHMETLMRECYGTRIFSIHLVNAPSYMGTALAVMKRAFKPKLFSRITAHDSSRELLDLYPKEILPKDFGGEERSLAELAGEREHLHVLKNGLTCATIYLLLNHFKIDKEPGRKRENIERLMQDEMKDYLNISKIVGADPEHYTELLITLFTF